MVDDETFEICLHEGGHVSVGLAKGWKLISVVRLGVYGIGAGHGWTRWEKPDVTKFDRQARLRYGYDAAVHQWGGYLLEPKHGEGDLQTIRTLTDVGVDVLSAHDEAAALLELTEVRRVANAVAWALMTRYALSADEVAEILRTG
jgi:hypothetical protein